MVTRLAEGKGIELMMEILDSLLSSGVQFVMLGRGDRKYEDYFCALSTRYPGCIGVKIAFDEALAHQTVAGADMLLMPSRHEPCGLTQMYALKYGTVPVVRRTGGLADSVKPYDPATGSGDGFLFDEYSGAALLDVIKQALAVYDDSAAWQKLARRGMAADHSWNRSMQEYLRLYRDLIPRVGTLALCPFCGSIAATCLCCYHLNYGRIDAIRDRGRAPQENLRLTGRRR